MFKLQIQLCCILVCLMLTRDSAADDIGPADIEIEGIEECENPDIYTNPFNIKFSKVNRTHVGYSACYEFPTPMDASYKLNVTAAKWGDGGWKPNAFDFASADACNSMMNHVEDLWKTIQRAFGVPEACPVMPGMYCINNLVVPLANMFPSMLYGKFRVDIMLHASIDPLLCFRVFLDSVESKE